MVLKARFGEKRKGKVKPYFYFGGEPLKYLTLEFIYKDVLTANLSVPFPTSKSWLLGAVILVGMRCFVRCCEVSAPKGPQPSDSKLAPP